MFRNPVITHLTTDAPNERTTSRCPETLTIRTFLHHEYIRHAGRGSGCRLHRRPPDRPTGGVGLEHAGRARLHIRGLSAGPRRDAADAHLATDSRTGRSAGRAARRPRRTR